MALPVRLKITTTPSLDRVALPYRKFRKQDIAKFLERLAEILHKHIVEAAPERTGVGKGSIVLKQRGDLAWEVLIDRRRKGGGYMTVQEVGATAAQVNPILPRKKKALWWPGLEHPVAAVTNHPGVKALHYFDRGADAAQGDLRAAEAVIGDEIARKFEE